MTVLERFLRYVAFDTRSDESTGKHPSTPGQRCLAEALAGDVIRIPECSRYASALPTVAALQLLAYYIAAERGCEIDQPRNLAKSVTVE